MGLNRYSAQLGCFSGTTIVNQENVMVVGSLETTSLSACAICGKFDRQMGALKKELFTNGSFFWLMACWNIVCMSFLRSPRQNRHHLRLRLLMLFLLFVKHRQHNYHERYEAYNGE